MYIKVNSNKSTKDLKKIIFMLLGKKLALKVEKVNYVKTYSFIDKKMSIKNEQILNIYYLEEKKEALLSFLKDNFDSLDIN